MNVRHIAVIGALLAVGALGASPFYRPQAHAVATINEPMTEVPNLSKAPTVTIAKEDHASSGERSPMPLVRVSDEASETDWANPTPIALTDTEIAPPLPPMIPVFRKTEIASSAGKAAERTIREPLVGQTPTTHIVAQPKARRHRITASDSLSGISRRYFGDESKASDIAAANSDVIRDPSLLPVGKMIEIPRGGNGAFSAEQLSTVDE